MPLAGLALMGAAALLSACMAQPGPPPTVEPEAASETATSAETTDTEPSPSESTEETTSTQQDGSRSTIAVGVDPVRNGFNPHLLADTSAVVTNLADLVLPSAFVDGEMNADLLVSAEEVDPGEEFEPEPEPEADATDEEPTEADTDTAAETTATSAPGTAGTGTPGTESSISDDVVQTVRYEIDPAAQWSDGMPITGADFIYLWESIVSTPGTIDSAPYRAIAEIRSTNAGRIVEVDFASRVDDWQTLFTHLLPSHLAEPGGGDFATAFYDDIPAGGDRFMVRSVDRSRGIITLHRNDRFWGDDPANFDVLSLHYVNSVTQGIDLLRSGQVSFLDRVPAETSRQAYELLPGTQTRVIDGPHQLQLDLNTASDVLGEHATRAELASLIDVPLIARQAAGRTADLRVPEHDVRPEDAPPPEILPAATADEPLRIAADPADTQASAAVRTIADLLAGYGIDVEIVSADLPTVAGADLPEGDIDATVTRVRADGDRADLASRYLCSDQDADPRYSNLSGYCTPESDELAREILAGSLDLETAQARIAALNAREHLTIPLLGERRIAVLGEGIVGPDEDFGAWSDGLSTAASWRIRED